MRRVWFMLPCLVDGFLHPRWDEEPDSTTPEGIAAWLEKHRGGR